MELTDTTLAVIGVIAIAVCAPVVYLLARNRTWSGVTVALVALVASWLAIIGLV